MAKTCDWTGASGTKYTYSVHELPVSFDKNNDGNYIYSKLNQKNQWVPIYIGEGNLGDRVSNDHRQAVCIKYKGATHVHAHPNHSADARKAEGTDLLGRYTNAYKPNGCNEKTGG